MSASLNLGVYFSLGFREHFLAVSGVRFLFSFFFIVFFFHSYAPSWNVLCGQQPEIEEFTPVQQSTNISLGGSSLNV